MGPILYLRGLSIMVKVVNMQIPLGHFENPGGEKIYDRTKKISECLIVWFSWHHHAEPIFCKDR